MRMRLCRVSAAAIWLALSVVPSAGAQKKETPEPAPKVMRYIQRSIAWYPNSVFRLVENTRYHTPSGSYRLVEVSRTCASQTLTVSPTMLVDEMAETVWEGGISQLPPFGETGAGPEAMRNFLSGFLPEALSRSRNLKVTRMEWNMGPRRPGPLMPLTLMVDTGYGEYGMGAAVTADGKFLVIGFEMPLKEDPVAVRRRLFAESDLVTWDADGGEDSALEIVEFSDLECPACRSKWPLIKMALGKHAGEIRHGMVSFPLTGIHPWAFRAASASWCVAAQDPDALIPFKETFYSLQREMEVSLVTPTSVDFLAGHGLDETAFRACYLRNPSIEAVLRQRSFGHSLGVRSTPTYFVNGWLIQLPDGSWFPALLERLLAGEEP